MRVAVGIYVSLFLLSPARATETPQEAVDFQQKQNVYDPQIDFIKVGISVKNITSYLLKYVWIDCASISEGGNVLDVGETYMENVRPSETAFDFVFMHKTKDIYANIKCRIKDVNH